MSVLPSTGGVTVQWRLRENWEVEFGGGDRRKGRRGKGGEERRGREGRMGGDRRRGWEGREGIDYYSATVL